jgi:hypothetical protein
MFPLSKVWGWWLLVAQILNALLAALAYFQMIPGDLAWADAWKAHAAVLHGSIGVALGALQAFAKALPDTDGNGVPDLFEGR